VKQSEICDPWGSEGGKPVVIEDRLYTDVFLLEGNKYNGHSFVEDDVISVGLFEGYSLSLSRVFSAGDIFEGLF
jgi:hypothetical protein